MRITQPDFGRIEGSCWELVMYVLFARILSNAALQVARWTYQTVSPLNGIINYGPTLLGETEHASSDNSFFPSLLA